MRFKHIYILPMLLIFCGSEVLAAPKISFSVETSRAKALYSDISIPRNSENEFSFTDDLQDKAETAFRYEARFRISSNHAVELMAAPLALEADGTLNRDLSFSGRSFTAGQDVNALFRFDSYRMRYRYYFNNPGILESLGFTVQIRDAEIRLESPLVSASKENTGFVPLVNFILSRSINPKLCIFLTGEALFSKFGRAEDIASGVSYNASDAVSLSLLYRVVEGGSDVEEVYSFSWINYIAAAIEYRL